MSGLDYRDIAGWAEAEAFLASSPLALEVLRWGCSITQHRSLALRTNRSYVTLAMRRGFGYVWLPGKWLRRPAAEVVLSLALDHAVHSPRFKSVVHAAPGKWMHHLEVTHADQLDREVREWLEEARRAATGAPGDPPRH